MLKITGAPRIEDDRLFVETAPASRIIEMSGENDR
jgi:hypothetical protein